MLSKEWHAMRGQLYSSITVGGAIATKRKKEIQ